MSNKTFGYFTMLSILACLFSVLIIDQPLAFFINDHLRTVQPLVRDLTYYAEITFGFSISKYLAGLVLLLLGCVFYFKDNDFSRAKLFFFVSLTFIFARLSAGMLKNVFERIRPFELLETNQFGQTFFIDGGSSFPSGHAAHFWGLFLPLMFLFPKYKVVLLIVPVIIGLSRIIVNDHYLSDVLTSFYIAFFFTFISARIMNIKYPKAV
jgi:membrane-associated phospholipid phosphatase